MTEQAASTISIKQLMQTRDALIMYHALCAAAKLGLADLLEQGLSTTAELARELKVNEDALYRTLRALASRVAEQSGSSFAQFVRYRAGRFMAGCRADSSLQAFSGQGGGAALALGYAMRFFRRDSRGQLLSAVGMNISEVVREKDKLGPGAARSLEDMWHSIEPASAEIRTVSYLLHPPTLDEIGLQTALRWYVDGFSERSKIKTAVEVTSNFPRLMQDHELSLFRVAQECLTNIHRHSGSSTAFVRLSCANGKIELEVRDEGKGLNPEIQSKLNSGESVGVGFRGMQERMRLIGGKLTIQSDGGRTSVMVALPVNEEALALDKSKTVNPKAEGKEDREKTTPTVRAQGL